MSTIEFNESELNEMKRFYLTQLAEAESKVAHIKGVLAKLGSPVASVAAPVAVAETAMAEEVAAEAPADILEVHEAMVSYIPDEYTKRGPGSKRKKERKSKWSTYIMNTLRSKGELMTASEVVNHAMKRKPAQDAGELTVRGGINGSLNRLAREYFRLRTLQVEGRRGRYYGLAGWFNKDGSLKPGFGERFGKLNITVKDAVETGSDED
ncbi:MAG: hypothetical protein K9J06_03890 [Flavobacteriales bacterium]|nr:hypothetical protein [Flavobacteriales bacterium]